MLILYMIRFNTFITIGSDWIEGSDRFDWDWLTKCELIQSFFPSEDFSVGIVDVVVT